MRGKCHAIRHRFRFTDLAPPGHEQEKPEIEERTQLRNPSPDLGWWQDPEVAQNEEVHDENA